VTTSRTTHVHVQRMLDEIHQHYAGRLNLGTLAKTLGRQAAYLGRLFHDEVGVTVHDYVTGVRVDQAAAQVSSGEKIEAVALCTGYRSKKNFYRQFRRRFGCTPDEFRHTRPDERVASQSVGPMADSVQPDRRTQGRKSIRKRSETLRTTVDRTKYQALRLTVLAQQMVLRTFVSSPLAMLVTNDAGCYAGANDAAVAMAGYSMAELRGMPVDALLPSDAPSDNRCLLQILMSGSSSLPTNAVLRTKSTGQVKVHLISARNPLWEAGHEQPHRGRPLRSPAGLVERRRHAGP
jgi:PAS domain S-box-containing protein